MHYDSRLKKAFANAPVLPLAASSPYIIFSDCHRGNGTSNDNFMKNRHLYFTVLSYYYELGFTYIELGDGDELWENRNMSQIIATHTDVFWLFSLFHRQKRLYLLYGNHDMEKRKGKPLFPGQTFHEGLILEDSQTEKRLYLTHGHQADFLNSTLWPLSRFLVRYIWKPLEHLGVPDPTSAAKNYVRKERTERKLSAFALQENMPLMCGHTHRSMLNPESPFYMNTGSCVYPHSITGIEIFNNRLFLIKWTENASRHSLQSATSPCFTYHLMEQKDRTLFITREVLSSMPL